MTKYTELFLCLPFLKLSIFFLVRRKFFGRVYIFLMPKGDLSGLWDVRVVLKMSGQVNDDSMQ